MKKNFLFIGLVLLLSCGRGTIPILVRENGVTHKVPVTPQFFHELTFRATESSLAEIDSLDFELETVTVGLSLDARVGEGLTVQAGKTVDLHFERIP